MENEELEITACALFGILAPSTINIVRVYGFIKNCPITILIYSRNSHNFVDIGLVKRLTGHTFNIKIVEWL